MVLYSEHRELPVPKTFYAAIIAVKVRHLKFFGTYDVLSRSPYSKSVVLTGYQDLARLGLPHRVIPSPVPVRELDRLRAERQTDQLVAQGIPCITADSGEQALALLVTRPSIGLMITELHMQSGSGLELVRQVRQSAPPSDRLYARILPSGLGTISASAIVASLLSVFGSSSTRGRSCRPSATYQTLWFCKPSLRA